MKILMDADCLIKLTKAKVKELVCKNYTVIIPDKVKEEAVDNAVEHSDAFIIKENLERGLLTVSKSLFSSQKGEDAVLSIYKHGGFTAICSDDRRFIKRLQFFDIPYITPAVFIAMLLKKGEMKKEEAFDKLELLSPFISDDEYNMVRLILENWRMV